MVGRGWSRFWGFGVRVGRVESFNESSCSCYILGLGWVGWADGGVIEGF